MYKFINFWKNKDIKQWYDDNYIHDVSHVNTLVIEDTINDIKNLKCLTNLKILDIIFTNTEDLPSDIKYLINLEKITIRNNFYLEKLSININYLTKLEYFNCVNNSIINLDGCLSNLINLKYLIIYNNKLSNLPEEIKYLTKLEELNCANNDLITFPKIDDLINLKNLNLAFNSIDTIPTFIKNLSKLNILLLQGNNIKQLPIEIMRLKNLQEFKCNGNNIIYYPPHISRFLNKINKVDDIYNDNKSVHNSYIHDSVVTSIHNILNTCSIITENKLIDNIMQDSILDTNIKVNLITNIASKIIHESLLITYSELLQHLWKLIENNNDIKKIMNIDLQDNTICLLGKITKLINCLNGFTDLINIKISDNEQISNIIILIKQKYKEETDEFIKEQVIKELTERDYKQNIIDLWLDYI